MPHAFAVWHKQVKWPFMKLLFFIISLALGQMLWVPGAWSNEAISLLDDIGAPIGKHFSYLPEGPVPISVDAARTAWASGRYQSADREMLSFGIGAQPVWLAFVANNPTAHALDREVLVEVSWIDRIDLYFVHQGEITNQARVGDRLPYAERPVDGRYFIIPHEFKSGQTLVLMRVETPDPMVLPIYVTSPETIQQRSIFEAYSYGLLYGSVLALLAYNLILFASLRQARYFFYSLYLFCFIAMNLSYTGHGYRWIWPENPVWQLWSNPILMIVYAFSGQIFATVFLESRRHFPRAHRLIYIIMALFFGLETTAILYGSHEAALLIAFVLSLVFPGIMLALGTASVVRGISFAKYFLIATLAATIGASITAMTVWGIVPYSVLGYRAIEIGMVIDATLLALALADQFRANLEQKNHAEAIARIDPLTELNNRRGFAELMAPAWVTGLRHRRNMAVVLFDLDHFKSFNDTHGHAEGDKALRMVAKNLKNAARKGDIAARWGGEEFMLFLPETTFSEGISVAERLRLSIRSQRLNIQGEDVFVTASFGVAEHHGQSGHVDELIALADKRLYLAKKRGRDQVCAD